MEVVADHGLSVILSSHLVADLERVCDYLVVLVASRVQVAGEIEELLAAHRRLSGPRRDAGTLPADQTSSTRATPPGRARCSCGPTNRSSTPPGRSSRSSSRTWSWPTWRGPRRRAARRRSRLEASVIRLACASSGPRPSSPPSRSPRSASPGLVTGPHLVPPVRHHRGRLRAAQGCCSWPTLRPARPPAPERPGPAAPDRPRRCIGIFWGAPLVARELETGTFRLAWTQSVTRTRWLVVKLVLVGLAAIAAPGSSA